MIFWGFKGDKAMLRGGFGKYKHAFENGKKEVHSRTDFLLHDTNWSKQQQIAGEEFKIQD